MSDPRSHLPGRPSLEQLQQQAADLLRELQGGRGTDTRTGAEPRSPSPPTLADARSILAREYGFDDWATLERRVEAMQPSSLGPHGLSSKPPFYRLDWTTNTLHVRPPIAERDWDAIIGVMKELQVTGLNASGQLTDGALERLTLVSHLTHLNLDGSKLVTDAGLRHLARMPQLQQLNLSGWESPISDRGLEVLRHLTSLKTFQMCWPQHVSDAGVANLAPCDQLESVDLMGTQTGDGAIDVLTGKRKLRHFKTGRQVTDTGLALLHRFPLFKTWQHDGELKYGLMDFSAAPTFLLVDGPFTNRGLAGLVRLRGLFGLNLFWHVSAVTPDGLAPLADLPHLGMLGCQQKLCTDEAMRRIAALPHLRMLMCQDTVAGDEGFAALSQSRTIEYIWGRRCYNLHGRGFAALADMPALRGLSVTCKNVGDDALSALPRFPALKEFMPMDVPDEGFRHVARCPQLETLWCMYCRDTTDAATEHIAALSHLKHYYAGATRITDRSLQLLGRLTALERIELVEIAGITNAGLGLLSALPRLREITLEGVPNVTREGLRVFPSTVRVNYT